ncbi:hypothetical protein A9G29_05575 [Gilliamella sp. Fer2-1]|nr:hypothetical protein A9G29_05575 [Gilliamella apicola]
MTKYIESNDIQFRIRLYLSKTTILTFTDFYQRLENALKAYQDSFDSNMRWYLSKNSMRAKPEELVYQPEGFTDFGMKKLALAYKKIEKKMIRRFFLLMVNRQVSGRLSLIALISHFLITLLLILILSFFSLNLKIYSC